MESKIVPHGLLLIMIDAYVLCRECSDLDTELRFEQKIINPSEEISEKKLKENHDYERGSFENK